MALTAGVRLGPYEVLGPAGAGGMGEVYRARDTRLDRTVAIKFLPESVERDPVARRRLVREAQAAAALDHPYICTVHEVGESDDRPFIVMEYVEGQTLRDRLAEGPMPLPEALRLGVEVAEALEEAHAKGIIHRDLKPANIMTTRRGHAKVMDFGVAKRVVANEAEETLSALTAAGTTVGTLAYMSPEQLQSRPLDARSDVFSFGIVFSELLTGVHPFRRESAVATAGAILSEEAPPLSRGRPDLAGPLEAAVAKMLAKDRETRTESMHEVRAELAALLGAQRSVQVTRGFRQLALSVFGTLAAFAVVAGGWWLIDRFLTSPAEALGFKERDFALVADVENGTGEPVFDVALKSALETDLRQSRYVNVFDANQVENTLRLMRVPTDRRLDQEVGGQVCRRAGVRVLVVPRILRAGEAYQLAATLIEPATGRVIDEARVLARGREEVLLSAIDDLTRQVRRQLGESLASIGETDPPFAQYTTSSLEALQLVDLARRAWAVADFAKAERSFREALARDPRFAAARGSLGLVLIQFLGRPEEGKKELARALEEAGELSQREHLNLRALNKQFVTQDLQGALDDYRFTSELYPDMMQPYNNSGRILQQLGRFREAADMYDRAHRADRQSPIPLWNVYFLATQKLKDPPRAEEAARKLVTLQPEYAHATHALAWSLVMRRRFAEAEDAMRATLKLDPVHPYALPNLAHLLFRRGEATADLYRELQEKTLAGVLKTGLDYATLCLGLALRAAGQSDQARRVLLEAAEATRARGRKARLDADDEAGLAALLAGAGRTAEARASLARAERGDRASGTTAVSIARVYVLLGQRDRAAALVQHGLATGYEDSYFVLIDPTLAAVRDRPEIDRLLPAESPPRL